MKTACLVLLCFLSQLAAYPGQLASSLGDKLIAEDGQIFLIPEYWNPYRHAKHRRPQHALLWRGSRRSFKNLQETERLCIGSGDLETVYFLRDNVSRINVRGLQDRLAKTFTGGWDASERLCFINKLLSSRRVPFVQDRTSNHVGIFFDGTGSYQYLS